jgi:hypothetical protein
MYINAGAILVPDPDISPLYAGRHSRHLQFHLWYRGRPEHGRIAISRALATGLRVPGQGAVIATPATTPQMACQFGHGAGQGFRICRHGGFLVAGGELVRLLHLAHLLAWFLRRYLRRQIRLGVCVGHRRDQLSHPHPIPLKRAYWITTTPSTRRHSGVIKTILTYQAFKECRSLLDDNERVSVTRVYLSTTPL